MTPERYLVVPAAGDDATLPARLAAALAAAPAAALLLRRGGRDEAAYKKLIAALLPVTSARDCALLLEDSVELVAPSGADGVHVTGPVSALKAALAALKPDHIVGCGNIGSRHEAMVRGELDPDYLLFGDRGEAGAELAAWWAETFEVPSVYLGEGPDDPAAAACRSEFLGAVLASDASGAA